MSRDALIKMLLSLRSSIDAQAAAVDAALALLAEDDPPKEEGGIECPHPTGMRESMATMGHEGRWRCRLCGYIHDPEPEGGSG